MWRTLSFLETQVLTYRISAEVHVGWCDACPLLGELERDTGTSSGRLLTTETQVRHTASGAPGVQDGGQCAPHSSSCSAPLSGRSLDFPPAAVRGGLPPRHLASACREVLAKGRKGPFTMPVAPMQQRALSERLFLHSAKAATPAAVPEQRTPQAQVCWAESSYSSRVTSSSFYCPREEKVRG